MSLSKQRNYYRLCLLVIDKGSQVLRKCLEEYWKSLSFSSLQHILDANFHLLLDLYRPSSTCVCSHTGTRHGPKVLSLKQWNSLFKSDSSVSCRYRTNPSLQLDDLDVTLCSCLLINIKLMMNPAEKAAIVAIREARNYIAHANEAAISNIDFTNKWKAISNALMCLPSLISPMYENDLRRSIKDLQDKTIDDTECKRLVKIAKAVSGDEVIHQKIDGIVVSVNAMDSNVSCLLSMTHDTQDTINKMHTLTCNTKDDIGKLDEEIKKSQSLNIETHTKTKTIHDTVGEIKNISITSKTDILTIKKYVENVHLLSTICQSKVEDMSKTTNETQSIVVEAKDEILRTTEAMNSRLEEIYNRTKETHSICQNELDTLREQLGTDPKFLLSKRLAPETGESDEEITKKRKLELEKDSTSLQQFLVKIYRDYTDSIPLSPICPDECLPIDKIFGSIEMKEDIQKGRSKAKAPTLRSSQNEVPIHHECFREIKSYKDLFYDDESRVKRIYLTAGAGSGKSTLCLRMIADWCKGINKQKSADIECISENEQEMQNFSFVFFIPLRHVDVSVTITEMILDVLFQDYKEYHNAVKLVLKEVPEKCLIILDGLDEWSPLLKKGTYLPFDGLPGRRGTEGSTLMITSRPWKLESIRCKYSNLDKVVTIEGLDGHGLMSIFRNILENWYGILSSSSEFTQKSIAFEAMLNSSLYESFYSSLFRIPLIATFFITLLIEKDYLSFWMEKYELPDSMTSLYTSLLKLLIIKAHGTDGCKGRLTEHEKHKIEAEGWLSSTELPMILNEDDNILSQYSTLLSSISGIAFNSLLSDNNALVFRKDEITDKIGFDELNIALKLGFLCQSKVPGTIHLKRVKVNFFHKTLQEFFSALHIVIYEEQTYKDFCSYCKSVQTILDLSNVILFIIGLNQDLACDLSNHINDICEHDTTVQTYRRSTSRSEDMDIIFKMQLKFFKEYKIKSEFKISDIVSDESIYLLELDELSMIGDIINANIHNIRSLSFNFKLRYSIFALLGTRRAPNTFLSYQTRLDISSVLQLIVNGSKLQKLMVKGCIVETLESLSQNRFLKDSLNVLKITNTDMSLFDYFPPIQSGLLFKALQPLHNLTALSLNNLTLQSSDKDELQEWLTSTCNLEIFEFRLNNFLTDNEIKFDLRNNVHLKVLKLEGFRLGRLEVLANYQYMEDLTLGNISNLIGISDDDLKMCHKLKTVHINDTKILKHLFKVLPNFLELHSLYISQPSNYYGKTISDEDIETLANVLPLLKTVEHIRMRDIEFKNTALTLSNMMSSKLHMELWNVFMSAESWQIFVRSLMTTKPGIRVHLKTTNIDADSLCLMSESDGIYHSTTEPEWELFKRI